MGYQRRYSLFQIPCLLDHPASKMFDLSQIIDDVFNARVLDTCFQPIIPMILVNSV